MKFFGDSFNAVCSEIMKDWVLVNFKGLIFVTSLGISYAVFGLNSSPRHFLLHPLPPFYTQPTWPPHLLFQSHRIPLMLPRLFGV